MSCPVTHPDGHVCTMEGAHKGHGAWVKTDADPLGGWVLWNDPTPEVGPKGRTHGTFTNKELIDMAHSLESIPFDDPPDGPVTTDQLAELTEALNNLAEDFGGDLVYAVAVNMFGGAVPSNTYRPNDRETSRDAGEAHAESDVGRFGKRSKKWPLLELLERMYPEGFTDQEAAQQITVSDATSTLEGTRRRMSDLKREGVEYITCIGKRKNEGSEVLSDVWAISDAGRVALHNLRTTGWSRPQQT